MGKGLIEVSCPAAVIRAKLPQFDPALMLIARVTAALAILGEADSTFHTFPAGTVQEGLEYEKEPEPVPV
jgi:hypothetical protein